MWGEGFDCPRLDTLLLALPISWKGKLAQYAGRLHRSYPGKDEVRVYDYVDVHVPMLEKMYQRRLKGYAAIGYHVRAGRTVEVTKDLIYDGRSFWPVYCDDLRSAQKEILIVSPFMRRSRLKQLAKALGGTALERSGCESRHPPAGGFSREGTGKGKGKCVLFGRVWGTHRVPKRLPPEIHGAGSADGMVRQRQFPQLRRCGGKHHAHGERRDRGTADGYGNLESTEVLISFSYCPPTPPAPPWTMGRWCCSIFSAR